MELSGGVTGFRAHLGGDRLEVIALTSCKGGRPPIAKR